MPTVRVQTEEAKAKIEVLRRHYGDKSEAEVMDRIINDTHQREIGA